MKKLFAGFAALALMLGISAQAFAALNINAIPAGASVKVTINGVTKTYTSADGAVTIPDGATVEAEGGTVAMTMTVPGSTKVTPVVLPAGASVKASGGTIVVLAGTASVGGKTVKAGGSAKATAATTTSSDDSETTEVVIVTVSDSPLQEKEQAEDNECTPSTSPLVTCD